MLTYRKPMDCDLRMMAEAVHEWYLYYGVPFDEGITQVLCSAAIVFYENGSSTAEEIASLLIHAFEGPTATQINVPWSHSIH
jgi:hypothetical protein